MPEMSARAAMHLAVFFTIERKKLPKPVLSSVESYSPALAQISRNSQVASAIASQLSRIVR